MIIYDLKRNQTTLTSRNQYALASLQIIYYHLLCNLYYSNHYSMSWTAEPRGCDQWHKIWKPLNSSVLQWSVPGPVLFNTFINDPDGGGECILCVSLDDRNLGGVAVISKGRAVMQSNLNMLKNWAGGNFVKFCKDLHLEMNNSMHQNILGTTQLEKKKGSVSGQQVPAVSSVPFPLRRYPRLH